MQSLGTPLFPLCLKLHLFFSVWFILKSFKTKLPAKRTEEEKRGLELKTSVSLDCWNFQTLSQSNLLVTTLVDCGPRGGTITPGLTVQAGARRIIFMIFYYLESKHFLWWRRNSWDHHTTNLPAVSFFPWTSGPVSSLLVLVKWSCEGWARQLVIKLNKTSSAREAINVPVWNSVMENEARREKKSW